MRPIIVVLCFCFLATGVAHSDGREWQVPGDFETVQAACNSELVQSGDTIKVAAGDHSDQTRVEVREGVTLQGTIENGVPVSLIPSGDFIGFEMWPNSKIDGFRVYGETALITYGVYAYVDCEISNIVIAEFVSYGIALDGSKRVTVRHVTVNGPWNAIGAVKAGGTTVIRDCIVIGADYGIQSYDTPIDSDYNILENCEEPFSRMASPGPHDVIGPAGLNACLVPDPLAAAWRTASDGTDRGAGQWIMLDLRLDLGGGRRAGTEVGYSSGDLFELGASISNENCAPVGLDLYVILAAYGEHYFWPSWSATFWDHGPRTVPDGISGETLLEFVWPAGAGSGHAIFYGAALAPATDSIVWLSNMTSVSFSWGE